MPEGNSDAYKEMYEMGKRLMEMAEQGGYDPEGESEMEEGSSYSEGSEEMAPTQAAGRVDTALKMFK